MTPIIAAGRRVALLAAFALGACHAGRPTVPDPGPAIVIAPASPLAPADSAEVNAPAKEARTKEAPAGDAATSEMRVELPIKQGMSCTIVMRVSGYHEERPDAYVMTSIEHIAVDESPSCVKGTLFDVAAESAADPEQKESHEPLSGGILGKPGYAQDPGDGPAGINFVDMNFDGYLDLNIQAMMGAYNESRRYWLYDPKLRSFVNNAELGELLWPSFDPASKLVKAGGRSGGPTYQDGIYGWIGGKLETLESSTTTLGERPNGDPLPAGYDRWQTSYKRKNGKLVKVFDGALRPIP